MSDIIGIVGSISNPSNTRCAVEVALQAAAEEYNIQAEILHLAEFELKTADGRKLSEYPEETIRALDLIIESNAYIIGTPVYRGSYSGILKNLFDLIPRGMWQSDKAPLENSALGFIATGATPHHYLSVSQELGPIASFFGSYPLGSGVYVHSSQFEDYRIVDDQIEQRLKTLGKATIELSQAVSKSKFLKALGPQF